MKPEGAVRLEVWPTTIQAANEYVARWHRHHQPVRSALWAVACGVTGEIEPRGVAIFGRPKARRLQDGKTGEVVRVSTDGTPNACSFLYRAVRRAAQALGYVRVITYTLDEEGGASLRAMGATPSANVVGREWDVPSRRRSIKGGAQVKDKTRWELFGPATSRTE